MIARATILAYLAFLLAPIIVLAIGGFGRLWVATPLPEGMTLRWYAALTADPAIWRGLATSLIVMAGAMTINLIVVPPLAFALAVRGDRLAATLAVLIQTAPIAVPTGVFGFAIVGALAGRASWLQGSLPVLAVAHAILTLPYMMTPLLADMRERDVPALAQMAGSLGAPPLRAFVSIILPSASGGLFAGAAAVAAVSLGEFQLTNLVAGFMTRTYPLIVADAFQRATGFACAATMPLVLLALANAILSRAMRRINAGTVA